MFLFFSADLKSSGAAAPAEAATPAGKTAASAKSAPADSAGKTAAEGVGSAASAWPSRPAEEPEERKSSPVGNEPQDQQKDHKCNR